MSEFHLVASSNYVDAPDGNKIYELDRVGFTSRLASKTAQEKSTAGLGGCNWPEIHARNASFDNVFLIPLQMKG